MRRSIMVAALLVLGVLLPVSVHAQWMSQTISLRAGWNAVHLRVNPVDPACSVVFADTPAIQCVSWWNRNRADDGTGITPSSDLCNWYPNGSEPNPFGWLVGGSTYLIQASVATSVTITGTPALPQSKVWLGEPNLIGFNVPNGGVMLRDYLWAFEQPGVVCSAVQADNTTLRFSSTDSVTPGMALWADPTGAGSTAYMGALEVSLSTPDEVISWNESSAVRTISVKNVSEDARQVVFGLETSLAPPAGQGTLAGNVSLLREEIDWSGGYARRTYVPLQLPYTVSVAAGTTYELRIRPNLNVMRQAQGAYQGILTVSDAGSVVAEETLEAGSCFYRIGVRSEGDLASKRQPAGLWLGTVVLTGVNRAQMMSSAMSPWDVEEIQEATQPFQFRLIMHVDDGGISRILKEVFVATEETDNLQPVLLRSSTEAIEYRQAHPAAKIRRISSANFPFISSLELTGGDFAIGGSELTGSFMQEFDDKVNPFVHSFHPQHDNLDFNNQVPSMKESGFEGKGDYESWDVTRAIKLEVLESDPTGSNIDWNGTVTGGIYTETITGLNKTEIITQGAFRLTKVLDTPNFYH